MAESKEVFQFFLIFHQPCSKVFGLAFSFNLGKARARFQAGQAIDTVRFKKIVNQEVHEIRENAAFAQYPFHGRQEQFGGNQHMTDAISHAFHLVDLTIVDGRDRTYFFAFSTFFRA